MEQSRELAKGPIDLPFCLLVLLLTAIGLVMLLSASFPSAYYEAKPSKHNPMYYFERQAVFAVLGTTVMFIVSRFNYQRLRGAGKILLYISLFLLVIVLIPGIGQLRNGARRWIGFGRADVPALGDRKGGHRGSTLPAAFPEKRSRCRRSATASCPMLSSSF